MEKVLDFFVLSGPVLRDIARLSQRYPPIAQRKRDDNKNKICAFQGGGGNWGQRGKSSKTLFFMGDVMTIDF